MYMKIEFIAKGHENVLCKHKNTIEFTKDKSLTLRGDCILGVDSDFSFKDITTVLSWNKVRVRMIVDDKEEVVEGIVNKSFSSEKEIVLRKSDFISERTLLIRCDKACLDLKDSFKKKMASKGTEMVIILEKIN